MCGIAGWFARAADAPVDRDILTQMTAALRHRGPDESGVYIGNRIGLGNTRLSIIGVKGGVQPIGNEDGTLWIVFNGEAFNYIELKEELLRRGHRFHTRTDTEVVLHLYEEHGPDCLNRINGQFAFAVWDTVRQELFLARDRVGIRPLHYYQDPHRFVFASEIKALFLHPQVPRELDPDALNQIFTLWTTLPPRTAFRGVHMLPPGHWMRVTPAGVELTRYWSIPAGTPGTRYTGSMEDAQEELAALIEDAVRLRLRSDVPVGAYLSGGLDSSIVTALVAERFDNRLRTFSIGFDEARFDETPFQALARGHLSTDHTQIRVDNADIARHLPEVVWHCETPLLRSAPVPLFLLSRTVRDHGFKVVLTGEGADEVFAGYDIFKEAKVRRFWGQRPGSRLRPLLLQRIYPHTFDAASPGQAYLRRFFAVSPQALSDPLLSHRIRWQNTGRIRAFFSDELREALTLGDPVDGVRERLDPGFAGRDPLAQAQFLEMDLFLSNYLLSSQGDRVAMAHSLETRMPFLDYRVIEFAFRLPPHWKLSGLSEKHILRKAFARLLPPELARRPKQPYRAPIREAFAAGTEAYVDELLSKEALARSGCFHPGKAAALARKLRAASGAPPNEVQDMAFLGILTTQLLHRQYVERFAEHRPAAAAPDRVVVETDPRLPRAAAR
jgi:asparagine synthase (glutamine-hydrolysing)